MGRDESLRRWFGGSKATEPGKAGKGTPQRFYHGSRASGFTRFDPQKAVDGTFYFAPDPRPASQHAEMWWDEEEGRPVGDEGDRPGVYPVYLNYRNPLHASKPIGAAALKRALGAVAAAGRAIPPEAAGRLAETPGLTHRHVIDAIGAAHGMDARDASRAYAEAMGFDAIPEGSSAVRVLRPSQIKSVFARRFDPGSDDITD